MQTNINQKFQTNPDVAEAESILRSCVHCGFCTATCPTYQLLGDELDGPRGRIYLIKQVLEGGDVTAKTQLHLDRCLTCRSCETTCPSGVRYSRLLEIGRGIVEQQVGRSFVAGGKHWLLRKTIPYPKRFAALLAAGRLFKPLLPAGLKNKIPAVQDKLAPCAVENIQPDRKMLVLKGCAQSVTTANTNIAATRVLNKLNIHLFDAPEAGCCGAVSQHLSAHEEGLNFMRRNIDAWWPSIEAGVEAIVITASGCGVAVKEYADQLKHDSVYAEKAAKVSELAVDISQVIAKELASVPALSGDLPSVAFHSPCTLQHGQQLAGGVEAILQQLGFTLTSVKDAHLCCGSAGTYSILQKDLSAQLLNNKLASLQSDQPDIIATANVGCQMHLGSGADVPVQHWIELVNQYLP